MDDDLVWGAFAGSSSIGSFYAEGVGGTVVQAAGLQLGSAARVYEGSSPIIWDAEGTCVQLGDAQVVSARVEAPEMDTQLSVSGPFEAGSLTGTVGQHVATLEAETSCGLLNSTTYEATLAWDFPGASIAAGGVQGHVAARSDSTRVWWFEVLELGEWRSVAGAYWNDHPARLGGGHLSNVTLAQIDAPTGTTVQITAHYRQGEALLPVQLLLQEN